MFKVYDFWRTTFFELAVHLERELWHPITNRADKTIERDWNWRPTVLQFPPSWLHFFDSSSRSRYIWSSLVWPNHIITLWPNLSSIARLALTYFMHSGNKRFPFIIYYFWKGDAFKEKFKVIVELAYWRLLPRYRDNETLLHGSFVFCSWIIKLMSLRSRFTLKQCKL
jgi:hypothetical protein